MTEPCTGGVVVVRTLVALGVRYIFGVPGGQTLAITDAVRDSDQIEFVTTRHEGAAAVMADAYGRLTGTPAACLATTGPGATNMLTGVGGASRDSSPALVITCNNTGENIHKDDAQNADHSALFAPLVKSSRLVAHGASLAQAVQEAYVCAMTGTPGPVHLDFARDAIESTVESVPELPQPHPAQAWVAQRPSPDPDTLATVAARMAEASRPVLWIGNGVNHSRGGDAVLKLAETMNIPVITTFNGIGAVPTTHPLVFGALSRMGTALSARVLAESDLVLAVGNSLNAVSTSRWRLKLPEVIQIDREPSMIGRYYGPVTTGMVGDAAATLTALNHALQGSDTPHTRTGWIRELSDRRDAWWRQSNVKGNQQGELSPPEVIRRLREVSPHDTLLIPDAGNPGVWSFLWEIREPGSYIKPVGFGNMGFAVPAAVAASRINPTRPVLALVGDGSLGMSLAELETLSRVGGSVCVVVLNDAGYGNIRQEQILHFGGRTIGVDYGHSDFGMVARGLGMPGERVSDLDLLSKRVGEALARAEPVLFDVPIDPEVNAWTFPAFRPDTA